MTESEKKAHKKYLNRIRTTTKAQLNVMIDRNDYDYITTYCKNSGMSKAQLIVTACKEYIKNNAV